MVADGTSAATVTVVVRDVNGNVVPGVNVVLAAAGASVTNPAGATDANGTATGSIRSIHAGPNRSRPAWFVALAQSPAVTFVGDASHVSATLSTATSSASALVADGVSSASITVTVRDWNGNVVRANP